MELGGRFRLTMPHERKLLAFLLVRVSRLAEA
jgi:hypothetical protein